MILNNNIQIIHIKYYNKNINNNNLENQIKMKLKILII